MMNKTCDLHSRIYSQNMIPFPVICSTLSPADLAIFVREKYALGENTSCQLLKTGINHTYRINGDTQTFIFRVYSYGWRTEEEITEELKLLQLLHQKGIPVSYPVADSSNNFIQTIPAAEGVRFAVLFSYAPGNKIQNYTIETHFEVGKLMAELHGITKGLTQKRVTYDPTILLHQPLKNIGKFLSGETEEMQLLTNIAPILEKELLNAGNQDLRKGIVHLDIWFDNMNISGEDKITLFDFDFCGNGWLCLDIAYYIKQLYNTEKDETERSKKIKAFYHGYESIEKIGENEKRVIPILGICLFYFYLGTQCQRFDDWANTFINEVYLKRFITVFIKEPFNALGLEK